MKEQRRLQTRGAEVLLADADVNHPSSPFWAFPGACMSLFDHISSRVAFPLSFCLCRFSPQIEQGNWTVQTVELCIGKQRNLSNQAWKCRSRLLPSGPMRSQSETKKRQNNAGSPATVPGAPCAVTLVRWVCEGRQKSSPRSTPADRVSRVLLRMPPWLALVLATSAAVFENRLP